MSKLLEDLEKLASAEVVDLSVADAARDTIIRQQEEIAALRAQLEDRYISMRVRQLEEALDAERETVRRLRGIMSPAEKMVILDKLEAQERRRRAALEDEP